MINTAGSAQLGPPRLGSKWADGLSDFAKYKGYFKSHNLLAHLPHFEPSLGGSSWANPAVRRSSLVIADSAAMSVVRIAMH